jgi:mannose/cellobiose epimerase-like protein (N-acyl-D-glucosamine 2-epimerase family)
MSAAIPFDEIRRWTFDVALPLWARCGLRPAEQALCREAGLFRRSPSMPGYHRTRVIGRQTYVFSHAAILGWDAGHVPVG